MTCSIRWVLPIRSDRIENFDVRRFSARAPNKKFGKNFKVYRIENELGRTTKRRFKSAFWVAWPNVWRKNWSKEKNWSTSFVDPTLIVLCRICSIKLYSTEIKKESTHFSRSMKLTPMSRRLDSTRKIVELSFRSCAVVIICVHSVSFRLLAAENEAGKTEQIEANRNDRVFFTFSDRCRAFWTNWNIWPISESKVCCIRRNSIQISNFLFFFSRRHVAWTKRQQLLRFIRNQVLSSDNKSFVSRIPREL